MHGRQMLYLSKQLYPDPIVPIQNDSSFLLAPQLFLIVLASNTQPCHGTYNGINQLHELHSVSWIITKCSKSNNHVFVTLLDQYY